MVPRCSFSDCNAGVPKEAPASPDGGDILINGGTASPEAAGLELPVPAALKLIDPGEPLDVLALATKRLAYLKGRIAELRKFEREAARLEALLIAAEVLDVDDGPIVTREYPLAGVAIGAGVSSSTTSVGH